ncbi:transcription factor BTF34 [Hordeum vulgare]|nr:transcription factor BTF34 [Hordeum vulgare]
MGEVDLEDAVLPWSVREISDDNLYRDKVRPDNMEHMKRIAEEMQKQVAAAGAIQPKEEIDLEFGCIM